MDRKTKLSHFSNGFFFHHSNQFLTHSIHFWENTRLSKINRMYQLIKSMIEFHWLIRVLISMTHFWPSYPEIHGPKSWFLRTKRSGPWIPGDDSKLLNLIFLLESKNWKLKKSKNQNCENDRQWKKMQFRGNVW